MNRRHFLGLAAGTLALPRRAGAQASVGFRPVLTRGYDNTRSCSNTQETVLTPGNVRNGMRKYFSLPMEGDARGAEAQPLFVPGLVTEDGNAHNAVIVCSMNNLVYCFDADNSAILWVQKLATPVNGGSYIDVWQINDHWGILSTPVIDPDTNIMYCTAWTSPDGTANKAAYFLHALNLTNGTRVIPPVSMAGVTYRAGGGIPVQVFNGGVRKQRVSLLLTNVGGVKTVFFAAGSVFENSPGVSGWVIAYDVASSVPVGIAIAPRYSGGGIWMAGQGLAADPAGNVYFVSGNGGFDGITDFSECYVRIAYTPPTAASHASMTVADWWSPYSDAGRVGLNPAFPSADAADDPAPKLAGTNVSTMPVNGMSDMKVKGVKADGTSNFSAWSDEDLGSSGINIIPELNIGFSGGKDGILYVVRLNNMGRTKPADFANPASNYAKLATAPLWYTFFPGVGVNAAPANVTDLDVLYGNVSHHLHSTSVVYKSAAGYRAYCWGENGNLRAWAISSTGQFTYLACSAVTASPAAQVPPGGMPGGMLSLSANGTGNAILWACVPQGDANKQLTTGNVMAYDATNFGTFSDGSGAMKLLWTSPPFLFNKFCPPVVNGGKLFVTNYSGSVDVYGL